MYFEQSTHVFLYIFVGHQKKMMLAIKKIKNFNSYNAEVIYSPLRKLPIEKPSHFSNPNSCPNMMMIRQAANNFQLPINPHCQTANNFQLPINSHCQEVPIKTNPHKAATPESPTANLKTFQQNIIQTNGFMLQRQSSEGIDMNYYVYDDSNNYYQNVRGRSLESLNYSNTENGFRQFNENQRNSFNPNFLNNQLKYQNHCKNNQGYETDSEIINNKLEKSYYEYDATATLNRPKNFIKNKPIAKIAAKTRDSRARITLSQQVQDLSPTDKSKVQFHCVENPINYSNDNISQSDNYANFKRKTPPPPPKRTNSIKSNTRCLNSDKSSNQFMMQHQNGLDEMQDQAFATCVKSLASRFSMMATRKSPPPIPIHYRQTNNNEIHQTNNNETHQTNNYEINQFNNDDFPPPPSPLLCKSEHSSAKDQFNVSKMDTSDREANISSSSSTESMPFANDNMGTIKFKEPSSAIHHNSVNNSPLKDFSKNNYIHSFKKEVISPKQKKLNGFDGKEKLVLF